MNYTHFTELNLFTQVFATEKMYIGMFGKLPGKTCLANCQIIFLQKNMDKTDSILYISTRSHKKYHTFLSCSS